MLLVTPPPPVAPWRLPALSRNRPAKGSKPSAPPVNVCSTVSVPAASSLNRTPPLEPLYNQCVADYFSEAGKNLTETLDSFSPVRAFLAFLDLCPRPGTGEKCPLRHQEPYRTPGR